MSETDAAKKNKFFPLTPEKLCEREDKKIYTEALEYAYGNEDIKNIAITGIYGAGKSTVWKTYCEYRKKQLKDNYRKPIVVSLGIYEDDEYYTVQQTEPVNNSHPVDEENNNIDKSVEGEIDVKKLGETRKTLKDRQYQDLHTTDRIEKQIINQILSQVDVDTIPLSKYKFKENKTLWKILLNYLPIAGIIMAVFLLSIKKELLLQKNLINLFGEFFDLFLYGFILVLLLVSTYFIFIKFIKNRSLKISKLNFNGAEADLDLDNEKDETILDKDIKEIVYILYNSKVDTVVFEDLDRYDDIAIFTKLRELNFLLNQYIQTNDVNDERIVRFIYMIRDGIFNSKNRTKFFDFIVPIVPVIDSNNSEKKLKSLINSDKYHLNNKFLYRLSLYIDDMRLLKNIINEFVVYNDLVIDNSVLIENDEKNQSSISEHDKLLALITYKNIFPKDFDLLQNDRGYVYEIIDNIKKYKEQKIRNLNDQLENLRNQIDENLKFNNDKQFKYLASCISPKIQITSSKEQSWEDLLRNWSKDKNIKKYINDGGTFQEEYTYQEFLDQYIFNSNVIKEKFNRYNTEKESISIKLSNDKNNIKNEIDKVKSYTVSEVLKSLEEKQREEAFNLTDYDNIIHNHYFGLIQFLITEGFIGESYRYYKTCFNECETDAGLSVQDTVFIKNILDSKGQDIRYPLDKPEEILYRLYDNDFYKWNILNISLFKKCIEKKLWNEIIIMMKQAQKMENEENLEEVLKSLNGSMLNELIRVLSVDENSILLKILAYGKHYEPLKCNILAHLYSDEFIKDLSIFHEYMCENSNSMNYIPKKREDIFFSNLIKYEIKFDDLSYIENQKDLITRVMEYNLYVINFRNVSIICNAIIGKENVDYSRLLTIIDTDNRLAYVQKYVDNHYLKFVEDYINKNEYLLSFKNDDDILVRILNSDLDKNLKIQYIENNVTELKDLNRLDKLKDKKSEGMIDLLFKYFTLEFNLDNLNTYLNIDGKYEESFINYINGGCKSIDNISLLLSDTELCQKFIFDKNIDINIISHFGEKADLNKINLENCDLERMVRRDLIAETTENFYVLLKQNNIPLFVAWFAKDKNDSKLELAINDANILELMNDEIINRLIYIGYDLNKVVKILKVKKTGINLNILPTYNEDVVMCVLHYENPITENNLEYIANHFNELNDKEEFIKALIMNDQLQNLKSYNSNKDLMTYLKETSLLSNEEKKNIL